MISRRSLLVAAPLVLYSSRGRAWFPHGVPLTFTPTITFNISHDSTWDYISNGGAFPNLPDTTKAQADAVVAHVVSDMESWFTVGSGTAASVNIGIGWGRIYGGGSIVGIATSTHVYGPWMSYSTMRSTLLGLPTDAVKSSGYNSTSLPSGSDPCNATNGYGIPTGTLAIWNGANDANTQATGFASSGWDYTADGKSNSNGGYPFYDAVTHEFVYALNHNGLAGYIPLGYSSVSELFCYDNPAPGVRDVGPVPSAASGGSGKRYFSLDNGATSIGSLYASEEDASFNSGASPLNVFSSPGAVNYWRAVDMKKMSILGMPLSSVGKAFAGI